MLFLPLTSSGETPNENSQRRPQRSKINPHILRLIKPSLEWIEDAIRLLNRPLDRGNINSAVDATVKPTVERPVVGSTVDQPVHDRSIMAAAFILGCLCLTGQFNVDIARGFHGSDLMPFVTHHSDRTLLLYTRDSFYRLWHFDFFYPHRLSFKLFFLVCCLIFRDRRSWRPVSFWLLAVRSLSYCIATYHLSTEGNKILQTSPRCRHLAN